MFFLVRSSVRLPIPVDPETWASLLVEERKVGLELYESGVIKHLWNVTGKYEAVVIYEVDDPAELHTIIKSLPLWQYLDFEVESIVPHYYELLRESGGSA